jgi:hypothetical protein
MDLLQMGAYHVSVVLWLYFAQARGGVTIKFRHCFFFRMPVSGRWSWGGSGHYDSDCRVRHRYALGFLLFLAYQVWWQSGHEESGNLAPVDLDAFRNLIDPQELQFLKRKSVAQGLPEDSANPPARRRRLYLSHLQERGPTGGHRPFCQRSCTMQEIAAAGLDVVQRALRLKLWCSLSLMELNATLVFPTLLSPSGEIADRYLDVSFLDGLAPQASGGIVPA